MNRELSPWTGLPGQSLYGRDPYTSMQRQVDRLFDDFLRPRMFDDYFRPAEARSFAAAATGAFPSVDVSETDKAYLIAAELPGLERKDVEVKLRDNLLTISGEKKVEQHQENGHRTWAERAYGHFERTIPLDVEVDAKNIEAEFKNGLLKLTLPKDPAAHDRTRKIEIRG